MVTPADVSYSVASGAVVRGGRYRVISGDIGVAGDSLTDISYNSGGYRLGFPLMLYPPRITFNGGWQAQTISDLADRFQAMLDAFPNIATWVIRIGTNGAGTGTYQTQFGRLFSMLSASGKFGVFHSIPPRGGTAGVDSSFIAENMWLQAQCESAPDKLAYIADSMDLGDANYNVITSYTVGDNIHMNGKGVYAQALRMAPRYSTIFTHTDPRILDGTDKYPSNASSNQYVQNPLMAGTGGTVGSGVTGVAPDNWSASGYGAGTGGIASIVAADAGDAVQVPWFRVGSIVSGGSTHEIDFNATLAHPAIAADNTIVRFDIVIEARLNALDTTVVNGLNIFPNVAGTAAGPGTNINLSGIVGPMTEHMVLRTSLPRTQQPEAGNSGTLFAYSANTLKLTIALSFNAAQATPMGSIDIRCVSFRGQTT